jgi:VWFA-related protein
MKRLITFTLSLSLLHAQQPVPQQTPPPAAQDEAPPTFKSTSNLVIVNVSVKNKDGKLNESLKKEDFILLEDGKPQTIAVFDLEKLGTEALPTIEPEPKVLKTRDKTTAVAKTETPAVKKDPTPAAVRHQDKRLLAMFFDFSTMQPPEQIRAKDAALKFIKTQMTASDLVSIMTYSNRIRVLEEFTDDRQRLIDTINSFRIGESSELAEATVNTDDADDNGGFTADDSEFNIFNTDRKLSALESAAKRLAMYPEKKALIYFSSGVTKNGNDNQSQLNATINAAVRSNVSFWPIDARGLVASAPAGDASTASPRGTGVFTGGSQRSQRNQFNAQQETLDTLAADTGGKVMLDSNDLAMGIKQAQESTSSYYLIGYYSTNVSLDGKYRRIKIQLKSDLKASLDYRNGYYAGKEFKKFTASDKERQLEEALALGDPVTDLPLAIEVDYFRAGKGQYIVPISVKVPGSFIELARKGAKGTTEMDFIGQVRDAQGKVAGGVRDGIKVTLSEADAVALSKKSLQYDTTLMLPPGDFKLKFLARENQTGKMGTYEASFHVPDLNQVGTSARLSSVVWSNQREPLSAAAGAAEKDKRVLAANPLVKEGSKLIPSITRVFRRDQNLYVYFEVYDPGLDPDRKIPNVAATLALYRGKTKVYESQPLRTMEMAAKAHSIPFQMQVALDKMPPGNYTGQVNVIDQMGKKFAFARTPLVVLVN